MTDEPLIDVADMSESQLSEFIADIANGSSELATLSGATEWCVALARRVVQLSTPVAAREVDTPCQCSFAGDRWHDELLKWLTEAPIRGVSMILSDGEEPEMGQAAWFITQHNWANPGEMGQFAEWLNMWADIEVDSMKYREEHPPS